MRSHTGRRLLFAVCMLIGVLAVSVLTIAQTGKSPIARYTATTENVGEPGQTVGLELFAWSSDADRDQFAKAWTSPVQPVQPAVAGEPPAGGGGGRGARGARGARGGRGGGGRGGDTAPPPVIPVTPTSSLAAALQKAPSVGMLWTSETVGYSIGYAYRLQQPDGSERIILATDRRLGAFNNVWKPVGTGQPSDYPFSIIELRVSPTGLGEGKASLVGPINVDNAKTISLENYAGSPVVLKAVKRQSTK